MVAEVVPFVEVCRDRLCRTNIIAQVIRGDGIDMDGLTLV